MKDKKIKILVMKFRHIGDVLLTTPLIENLRRIYPDAQIDFALNKGTEAMIEGNPNIQNIHIYDRANIKGVGFFKRLWRELKFIRAIKKQKYDIAVQTTTGDRGIIVAKYAKIKTIVGFEGKNKAVNKIITHKAPKIGGLRHTVDRNQDALAALGLEPNSKRVSVYFDPECIIYLNLPPKFIHVHLTSRWMFKCADDETMAHIIDFCESLGALSRHHIDKRLAVWIHLLALHVIKKSAHNFVRALLRPSNWTSRMDNGRLDFIGAFFNYFRFFLKHTPKHKPYYSCFFYLLQACF